MADQRVQFDFEIEFSNGGGLRGQGFRLDIEGEDIADEALADYLVRDIAALVGIDSLNIDDTSDLRRSAHSTLLGADIPIVEHLRGLERLPDAGFRFFAVPVKVIGLGTFPVRAFAAI